MHQARPHPNAPGAMKERDFSDEEFAFLQAIDRYKRSRQRPFPTWREVLAIVLSLGYRKVVKPARLPDLPLGATPWRTRRRSPTN